MRACLIEKFGSLEEQLQIANVGLPLAGPDELLVKVFAASVNPSDWKLIDGRLQALFPVTLPRILGRDCAGAVVSGRAAGLAAGDRVLAVADARKNGTHAEYAVVPSCQAAPIPASLSNEEAVAIGNSGATAWICLVDVARIASGQRVLIHAGAGAVGGLAIQLSRHFGAEVITTCRGDNLDHVRSLGAHLAIDYTREDFVKQAGSCDVVFDMVGGEVNRRSYAVLKPGGMLVYVHALPIGPPLRNDVRVQRGEIRPMRHHLQELMRLAAANVLKPRIGAVWPLAEARAAYARAASGQTRGKNILLCG